MKKVVKVLFVASSLACLSLGVTACSTGGEPTTSMTSEEAEARSILDAIPVEDYHVVYDGKEHHIREAQFKYPSKGNVSYGSYDKFIKPGTYPYHVSFGLNGYYREVDVNLIIEKRKPVYTGPTEVRVFLDERNDFDVSFDIEGVELKNPINLTQVGDYKVKLETKETDTFAPMDPVEVQVYVRDVHHKYEFKSKHELADGTAHKILLEGDVDESLFDVVYTNNEGHTERGKYYITATLTEKSNGVVYDTYRAILTVDTPSSDAFDDYVDEMFVYFMGGDQISSNILLGDYASFGIDHVDCDWYSFERFTDADFEHDTLEVKEIREAFNEFDPATLSDRQLNDYKLIDEMIKEYEMMLSDKDYLNMRLTYVDQYGGYAAELPSEVEGFHINNKEDLDDMVHLLNSVYDSFMTYYDYIEYREEVGYPLNEYTLTNFIDYLDGVVDVFENTEEDYYLISIVNGSFMLNENLGLTLAERKDYANDIKSIFNGSYYQAHKDLRDKVQDYLDEATAEGGYLANPDFDDRYFGQYEKGKDLYLNLLKNKLGCFDLDPEEYIAQIDKWLKTYLNQWSDYSNKLSANAKKIANGTVKIVEDTKFDSLLAYLKEFAKTVVPDLTANPTISVAWMDKTVTENTTTAAYYMKSPLSESGHEYIHLNEKSLGKDYLDTLSTLAHEGYPGHLYAYVNVKENENLSPLSTVNTNTTHGEGWATYVQIALNNYIADTKKDASDYADWKMAMDYANAYDLMSYLLYTKCDYVVNYQGADVSALRKAINKVGLSLGDKDEDYLDLFHTFNENPASYPAYGFGKAYFWQLHLDAEKSLGDYYNVVDFNKMLLEHGWCSIDRLQDYYEEYIADNLFLNGLAVSE